METLRVGAAFPDPPFNGMPDDAGLDIDLMTEIAEALGATVEFVPYEGADFNGIFDALGSAYDCVAAGTTVTPDREKKAQFVPPYLISGQSLAVDTTRLPGVKSIDDLAGLTIGVQQGNTSQPIADRPRRGGQSGARPRLRLRQHPHRADRPDHRRLRRVHEAGPGADRTGQADPRRRGGAARHLRREHRHRRRARRPGPARPHHASRRPSWKTTARCSGSAANGWVIRTPTRAWPVHRPARAWRVSHH